MQKRLNINGRILSLTESPSSYYSSVPAQDWCRQQIKSGQQPLVWFLKDAVYHVLNPAAETARVGDVYAGWEFLHSQGARLLVCQSACQRRLPAGSVNEDLFEISTLTRWADDLSCQLDVADSGISCIIRDHPPANRFIRESIDSVLSLLAMELSVRVIFADVAIEHLLEDRYWRKWRVLPETEEQFSLMVLSSEVNARERQWLLDRPGVEILTVHEYAELIANGSYVYV